MTGLTNEQVQERIAEGKVNVNENPNTRTYKQIILENTLTFFNFLNIALLVLVLFVRSYKNSMFMGIILINTVIGIIQEIRAKKTIDKLAILTESKTVVLREGKKWSISTEKLVLDDLIFLKTGDQVPADVKVLEGTVEVNESLLTGESDNLSKSQGDELFSGSFVTSGEACCQVIHVGKDNYASQITSEAKEFKRHNSELRNSLNAILKVISIIIVPLGAMLFYKQYMIVGDTLKDSVVNMVAAVLGMIPEGLVLLTSVALTLGSMVLATKKTLVQELYCIETLARVDTLCLDKTGTITEGTMKVEDVQLYDTAQTTVVQHTAKFDPETGEPVQNVSALKPEVTVSAEKENGQIQETVNLETVSQEERQKLQEIDHIMGNMMSVLHDQNATADALRKRFPSRNDLKLIHAIPFSSDRKYSGAVFEGRGTYLMGAAQFLFPEGNEELLEHCSSYAQEGHRILVLAHSEQETKGTERPTGLEPLGLFLITDVIREEAQDTLAFFDSQGVDLKVISGDDPVTVSAIAKKAGLKNANHYIDATTIKTSEEMQRAVAECSVFGRVTPQQKKQMVQALQSQKHTVAMTGDGVNDAPALKKADIGVAMGITGTEVSKDAASMILTDDNFATIVKAVENGRNLYRNIKFAIQFLLSGNFGAILAVLVASIFALPVPFAPVHLLFINLLTDSLPAIALGLEPHSKAVMEEKPRPLNESILTKDFLLRIAVEGVSVCATTMTAFLIGYRDGNALLASTMAFATLCSARLFHGFNCKSNKPVVFTKKVADNKYLIGAFALGILLVTAVVMIPGLHTIFKVQTLSFTQLFTVYGLAALNIPVIQLLKAIWVKAGK